MTADGNTFFFHWEVQLILIIGFLYWSYDKKLGRTVGLGAIMALTWATMIATA